MRRINAPPPEKLNGDHAMNRKDCNGRADNGRLSKEIQSFLREAHPGRGVDSLVVEPAAAMRLCADVARAESMVTAAEWNAFSVELGVFEMKFPKMIGAINKVCRAAMNGRKRGEIKPSGSSPAIRAAATRASRKRGRR